MARGHCLILSIDSTARRSAFCLMGFNFGVAQCTHTPTQFQSSKLMQRNFICNL